MRTVLPTLGCAIALGIGTAHAQTISINGNADQIWRGTQLGAKAGQWLDLGAVSAGDGRSDLIIGAPGTPPMTGAVYVIYGGPPRTGDLSLASADTIITGAAAGDQFGYTTAAGNVITPESSQTRNLVVAAPGAMGGRGIVYVYLGGFGVNARLTSANAVYVIIGKPGDQLGTALATADLDNDGFREIIMGAAGNDRMYVIKGGASLSGTRDLTVTAPELEVAGVGFGDVLAAGDVTGDGISDLLVGSGDLNTVYFYKGRSTGGIPTTPDGAFGGARVGDRAGASIRLLDIDHDGIRDVIIGAPGNDGAAADRANAGAVYLIWGTSALASRALANADVTFYGATAGLQLGAHISAGDINRDTPSDIVMMGPGNPGDAGELDIYYGRSVRTQYGADRGDGLRVVDFADPSQIDRKILGEPSFGAIAFTQVFEVTGEGARDIVVSVPGQDGSTGAVYFTISPSLSLNTTMVSLVANRDTAVASLPITISNRSIIDTTWSATSPQWWVTGSPAAGSSTSVTPGSVSVVASAAGIPPGFYATTLNVRSTSKHLEMSIPVTVTLTVTDTILAVGAPANGETVTLPFTLSGWAIDRGATGGTGVDAIHVYARRNDGSNADPIFLGTATYGVARPDVAGIYGSQFTNSGFQMTVAGLPAAPYHLTAYAHHAATNTFTTYATRDITVRTPGFLDFDTPREGAVVTSAFEVGGWAVDPAAPTGTGVDAVQIYIFTNDGLGGPVFIGQGSYGWARPDVGAIFGSRFTNSGYHFTVTGAMPGKYVVAVYARSTVTNTYSVINTVHVTVNANTLMGINGPSAEATIATPTFTVSGWALDRGASAGTGVDAAHVYVYRNPGSGEPAIFLGVATLGIARPDVAGVYGAQFLNSGYSLNVDRNALGLTPGVYNVVVWTHSSVSNSFNNVALVRVTLQ
jgi:hypothetical protein